MGGGGGEGGKGKVLNVKDNFYTPVDGPITLYSEQRISTIERFSIECRKTKTKVIINHNRSKQRNEPIRIRSKYM